MGHTLLTLTEDNEETGRLCPDIPCSGDPRSETDYISIYYGNDLEGGDNRFSINAKINGVFYSSPIVLFYNPYQKLFFELEKIGSNISLRVYEDNLSTILLNGQVVDIDLCDIAPLHFMQHGVSAAADYRRGLTGQIDNLVLDKNFTNACDVASEWHSNSTTIFPNFNKNIGIGTDDAKMKLSVVGDVGIEGDLIAKGFIARPEVWPDYVFSDHYDLRSLENLEEFIEENSHLPGFPSANEVLRDGSDLAATNVLLLEKIEELTLYIIQLNKEIEALKAK